MEGDAKELGHRTVTTSRDLLDPVNIVLTIASAVLTCAGSVAFAPQLGVLSFLAPIFVTLWWMQARSQRASLALHGGDLVLRADRRITRIPRDSLRSGYVAAAAGGARPAVVCERSDRSTIAFGAESLDDARSLLAALGFDPSQRRTQFRGVRTFHRLLAIMLAPTFGFVALAVAGPTLRATLGGSLLAAAMAAVWLTVTALSWVLMVPKLNVSVGLDGITVGGRLGERFYPWPDVEEVTGRNGTLYLRLRGGRRRSAWCNTEDATVLPALVATANEARENYHRASAGGGGAASFDRGGRTVAQWRDAMVGLLRRHADYRSAAFDRAYVESLLADPSTSVERRIGAAMALAHDADGEARSRVRVAAEVVADPDAREAITRIADGHEHDEAVEAALRGTKGS